MQYTDRGLTEITSGLAQAQGVLRRRKSNLQASVAGIEAEIAQLSKIEAAVAMVLEMLRGEKAAREEKQP